MGILTLAWWAAKLTGIRSGAGRWLNAETAKALSIAIVATAVLLGCVMLFRAGGSGREAKVNWRWLQQITALNLKRAKKQAADNAAMAQATDAERARIAADHRLTIEHVAALERQLAAYKDNPVAYPRDLARSLNK